MINVDTKKPLCIETSMPLLTITYHNVVTRELQIALGGMETHLIVRESETFYLTSTITNLWGNNETIQISNRELRHKDNKSDSHI